MTVGEKEYAPSLGFDFVYKAEEEQIRLETRYALTVLYYSTDGNLEWYNQNGFLSPHLHECSWKKGTSSGEETSVDAVVECNRDLHVTGINLGKDFFIL